jgi:Outer membrane protein beta-barrel domain
MKYGGWLLLAMLSAVGDAAAQPLGPIGKFVVDARGSFARFKEDVAVADGIDVDAENLPTRGLGIAAGAHWYPLRYSKITFGLGGEILLARDRRTVTTTSTTTPPTVTEGPTVTTRLSAIAPQLSFNFGHGQGWSYISGGIGWARITSEVESAPFNETAARTRAINYGGGARWFTGPHLAFTFDVRFYAISPRTATATLPSYPRTKVLVIGAGVSLK